MMSAYFDRFKKSSLLVIPFLFTFIVDVSFAEGPRETTLEELLGTKKPASSSKRSALESVPLLQSHGQKETEVEVIADSLEYSREEKKIIAKRNVVITYQDTKITADYAEVQQESKQAVAKGHVLVFRRDRMRAAGEEVYFNFNDYSGEFPMGTCYNAPWSMTGKEIKQIKKGEIIIEDARVTTCEGDVLPYEIRASKARILSGDKISLWNVKLYIMGKPFFWFPYTSVPIRDRSLPFQISAGHNSEDGYYIETTKGFSVSEHISGKFLADWRSKRGFAGGAILDYDYGNVARGNLVLYRAWDRDAPTIGLENVFSERQDRNRNRVTWRHRADIDPYSFLVLRYHDVTDEFLLQDFFEKEHRGEIEQQSFITFTKNSERYGFMAHVQKRVNDFEAVVERLPEFRFDWKNQPLFMKGLFYESQTSFVNLTKRFGRSGRNDDVSRFDNFHEWMVPFGMGGWQWTPFMNLRGTYYSRERFSDEDHFRFALGYGLDVRKQYYKTFQTSSDFLGIEINNLRHIVEPSFQWDAIHPSTVSDETLTEFDRIDRIDDRDILTWGVENRIQTKRVVNGKMRRVDIVSLNTFLSFEIKPDEPSSDTDFKTLTQEVVLRPYQWLQYEARVRYNLERNDLDVFNQDLIAQGHRWRFLFGHRYVKDVRLLADAGNVDTSHQFVFEGSYKVNPRWELHGHVRMDADERELEEWQIGATRDWGCLLFDFGYNVRNSSIRSSNKQLYFNLTLKDYPELALRSGAGRATFAAPRIGETVAGSNQIGGYTSYREQPV